MTRAARQRATVMTLSWLLVLAGAVSALRLALEFDTPPQAPQLRIQLLAPGVTAATLEQQVTRALETEAAQALAPRRIESHTGDGSIELRLDFDSSRQRNAAQPEAARIVERARQRWPLLFVDSRIERHPPLHPKLEYAFSTEEATLDALRAWIGSTLMRTLADVPGVAALRIHGGPQRAVEVVVDARRLAGFGLALDDLWRALRAAPASMPVSGLAALAVRLPSGETIGLGELAQITTRLGEHEDVRIDGRPAILVEVQLREAARLMTVAERIDAQLAWLQSNRLLPDTVRAQAVTDAPRALRLTAGQALAGVSAGLLLNVLVTGALVSWRRALYATFAVALSASLTVMVAALLAVAATPQRMAGVGFGAMLLVPLFSIGLRRNTVAFGDLRAAPRAPVAATLAGLVAALSVLTVFAQDHAGFFAASAGLLAAGMLVYRAFLPTLRRACDSVERPAACAARRIPAWVWSLLALGAAMAVVRVTVPPGADLHDSGQAVVVIAAPPEAGESQIDTALHQAAAALRGDAQVTRVTTRLVRALTTAHDGTPPIAATVKLEPRLSRDFDSTRWQWHVQGWIEQWRARWPAFSVEHERGAPPGNAVAVEIYGNETAMLEQLAATAIDRLKGLADGVQVTRRDPRSIATFQVQADADRLTEVGLDVFAVERSVSIARAGVFAGDFVDGEVRYRAYLRESRAARTQEELAGTLLAGELKDRPAVSLGSIGEVAPVSAPALLQRIDGRHGIRLWLVSMTGGVLPRLARLAQERLRDIAPPAGYELVVHVERVPRDMQSWDLAVAIAASLLALGLAAYVVAWRARDSAAVTVFAVAVPVLLCGLSSGCGGPMSFGVGFVAAGIVSAAARQLGLISERVTHPPDAADALRSGLRFLLPLAAGLLPIALGWAAPASLSGFAGAVAAGCLIAAGMLVATAALAVRRVRWNK